MPREKIPYSNLDKDKKDSILKIDNINTITLIKLNPCECCRKNYHIILVFYYLPLSDFPYRLQAI
jgi:hypothetical protein